MTIKKVSYFRGIILKPDDVALDGISGELKVDSVSKKIQAYLDGATRSLLSEDQVQTVSNKTIYAVDNNIVTLPSGNLTATELNAALAELQADVDNRAVAADLQSHIVDGEDVHDASAISSIPSGNLSSTTVQAALNELQADIDTRAVGTSLNSHTELTAGIHGVTGDVVGTSDTQVISNKTISTATNTITTIPSGELSATELQAALNELQSDIDVRAYDSDLRAAVSELQAELDTKTTGSSFSSHTDLTSGVHGVTGSVVGTTDTQTITNKTITGASIQSPTRSDVKMDTLSNLTTYALTASNGQIVYATDAKTMYQIVDTELVGIGGAGIVKLTAGEAIAAMDLVYISTGTGNDVSRTAGRLYKVDASNDDRVEILGFATKAATVSSLAEVQVSGNLSGFTGLTAGKVYYASATTPGAITLTPPSAGAQWIITPALAVSATTVVINPVSSASAIYNATGDILAFIINDASTPANIPNLIFDGTKFRGVMIDYTIYRQSLGVSYAQIGTIEAVYNTLSNLWILSYDFIGQDAGVVFDITSNGQVQYTSTNMADSNFTYFGNMFYSIRKTFGVS